MISGPQLRAARSLIDWNREELAKAAGVSPETVKNIETGTFRPQADTEQKIIRAFIERDVHFTENQGVQLRQDTVVRYEGPEGFRKFMDSVYEIAKESSSGFGGNKPIYISNVDDRLFAKHLGDYFTVHIKRMNELKDLKMRILIQDKPHTLLSEESRGHSYREYRHHPEQAIGNVPFYVYGDKLAILAFEGNNAPQIVVLASALVAKAYREQFEVMWKTAKPLDKVQAVK
jgi:DNA-binding XRE family transcriptional regulator